MQNFSLTVLVLIWAVVAALVAYVRTKDSNGTAGLVLAYLINFALLHWLAAVMYIFPWHHYHNPEVVKRGLEASTYAILAFAVGSLVLGPYCATSLSRQLRPAKTLLAGSKLKFGLVAVGWLATLATFTPLGTFPTVGALVSATTQLIMVGLCLGIRDAWLQRRWQSVFVWVAAGVILPLFTMAVRGFLGFGALPFFTLLCFLITLSKRRTLLLVLLTASSFLWVSFFVTYMRDRKLLRKSVWGGHEYSDRFDRLEKMITGFEWFDPYNEKQLDRIDMRLDQDYLVGRAVNQLERTQAYAKGDTMLQALLALVPRVLWPDKPVTAGSGNLVSRYTGLYFPPGTSVGVGHVMEFYINFGVIGVLLGFLAIGAAVSATDILARRNLQSGDIPSFSLWFVVGMNLLNVGGSLVELTATSACCVIVTALLNQLIKNPRNVSARFTKTPPIERPKPAQESQNPSYLGGRSVYGEPR